MSFSPIAPSEMTILKPEIADTPIWIENDYAHPRNIKKNETETTPAVTPPQPKINTNPVEKLDDKNVPSPITKESHYWENVIKWFVGVKLMVLVYDYALPFAAYGVWGFSSDLVTMIYDVLKMPKVGNHYKDKMTIMH